MEFSVVKKNNRIDIIFDNKKLNKKGDKCLLTGEIYNLDELKNFEKNITPEEKVLRLYEEYKDDLFAKLNGDFAMCLIISEKIIAVRNRLGSKFLYYSFIDNEFIVSTSLKYFISNYKDKLKIDKQILANYLCYSYIKEPNTIFESIKKIESGNFICFDKCFKNEKYYNIVEEYKKNKNKINNEEIAEKKLIESLKNAINKRVSNKNKIGIYLSAGIDSTLIAALSNDIPNITINTYTVGFQEKERNEADKAKQIAKYLKTNHQEFYLNRIDAIYITKKLFKVYSEPFADPSMLPIVFLSEQIGNSSEIILTGDGADQLFCGSNVYDTFNLKNYMKNFLINKLKVIRYHQESMKLKDYIYMKKKYVSNLFIDTEPQTYYNLDKIFVKEQIKYMLFDIKNFLSNRLFSKMSFPASYYNLNIAHPFIDNEVIDNTLKLNHRYKYKRGNKKYILKNILYKKIPKDFLNKNKNGFGIPLKSWLYDIFMNDIIKYSEPIVLEKQNLFSVKKMSNEIEKLKNRNLDNDEIYIMFAYYMFQLWYKEYIDDLWVDL